MDSLRHHKVIHKAPCGAAKTAQKLQQQISTNVDSKWKMFLQKDPKTRNFVSDPRVNFFQMLHLT